MSSYKENFQAILNLPIVQEIIEENKRLKEKNKKLKLKNKTLESILYHYPQIINPIKNNKTIVKKEEETPISDPEDVVYIEEPTKNIEIYDLTKDESVVKKEEPPKQEEKPKPKQEEKPKPKQEEKPKPKEEPPKQEEKPKPKDDLLKQYEELEEEDEQDGDYESDYEDGVFEIKINNKKYYTSNEIKGKIYIMEENEDVGPQVGVFRDGKPIFDKK